MKLSDMLKEHVEAPSSGDTGSARLTQEITAGGNTLPAGSKVTIMYRRGNLYHAEWNDFAAMLERTDFTWETA